MRFDDLKAAGLLAAREMVHVTPFPGTAPEAKAFIGIRLLSDYEIDQARIEGQLYMMAETKRGGVAVENFHNIDPAFLDREHQRQVIYRCSLDPNVPKEADFESRKFFASQQQVRELDSVLIERLWGLYTEWQEAVSPRLTLDEEQIKSIVEALGKEQSAILLEQYDRATLIGLVRSLGNQLST